MAVELLLLNVRVDLLLLLHVILSVVGPSIDLMCHGTILDLCQKRGVLQFDNLCDVLQARLGLVHMELSQLEFVSDETSH